jgi:hypothetical protein
MGNICFGGLLAAGGLGFALAALLGSGQKPPQIPDPVASASDTYDRKARWPLFLFGILFALFGVFIIAYK